MSAARNEGWIIAGIAIGAAVLLVAPVPTVALDLAYAASMTVSVALVARAAVASSQLELAWYPRAVVLLALVRVSLTVAATRLVLTRGDAGNVVAGLGRAVAGSSVVVGLVVLGLLLTVQLVVVGRGAERVAEVAARFSLDALPGAQLALDGDLRAGALEATAASRARDGLLRAARLSGALDGASRFVRGDAVASVLLLAVSLLGGVLLGVLERQMSAEEAFARFGLLTVGEGIGAQVPALLASIATGLLVTRGDEPGPAGAASRASAVPLMAGAFALTVALVPGLPAAPFAVIGAACVAFGLARRAPVDATAHRWIVRAPPTIALAARRRIEADLAALGVPLPPPVPERSDGRASVMVRGLEVGAADDVEGCAALALEHAGSLVGVEVATSWLDDARRSTPALVATVVPSRVSTPRLAFLLAELVSERVSVADREAVLEACLRAEPTPNDELFVERARRHLRGAITASVARDGVIDALGVGRAPVGVLREAARSGRLPESVRRELAGELTRLAAEDAAPVIVAPSDVRRTLRDALRPARPRVRVIGIDELAPWVEVRVAAELDPSTTK